VKTSATATRSGKDLHPNVHRYCVMEGETIIGQFSNIELATDTAHRYRGNALVMDISVKPHLMAYKDGRLFAVRDPCDTGGV